MVSETVAVAEGADGSGFAGGPAFAGGAVERRTARAAATPLTPRRARRRRPFNTSTDYDS
jgi:hypothetical protein